MNYLTTELGASPVIVKGIFPCSPDEAFNAWTDEAEIMQWFGAEANSVKRAEIELKIGGQWRFIFEETAEKTVSLEGEYLEISPGSCLVFSWRHVISTSDGAITKTAASKVSIRFNEAPNGTQITLNHENIQSEDGRLGVGKGWQGTFTSFQKSIKNKHL